MPTAHVNCSLEPQQSAPTVSDMMLFITMASSSFVCNRVGKDLNNDLLIAPSTNVGDRGELGVESCLVRIRNGGNNIRQQE